MSETPDEIVARFYDAPANAEWTPKTGVLPRADALRWMKSPDIEVLGLVGSMLDGGRFRVEPALTPAEFIDYAMRYYGRCFRENPDGQWAESRYEAGWAVVGTFAGSWDDSRVPRKLLKDLKDWLGGIYRDGDTDVRTCVVTATLEHLLERKDFKKYFADWKDDPVLAVAYREAAEWGEGGGKSPLGKPRKRK